MSVVATVTSRLSFSAVVAGSMRPLRSPARAARGQPAGRVGSETAVAVAGAMTRQTG